MRKTFGNGGTPADETTPLHGLDLVAGRRAFIRTIGLSATAAAIFGTTAGLPSLALAAAPTDAQILNFALNLEYLEAEFYLNAAFGKGLDASDTDGVGDHGKVDGGRKVKFESSAMRQYAEEIARDEEAHVKFLRSALGSAAVARPKLDIGDAFKAAAKAAGLGSKFDAYDNENNFLLAAFIFEDVGVTAYKGAARYIENKDYLEAAAGILAVEAYHAGEIRTLIYGKGQDLRDATIKISDLRDSVDGKKGLDQPVVRKDSNHVNIVPTDKNGLAFSRSTDQVLPIVYLGGTKMGGFFPKGLNGDIS